jgi:hypothetical protein
MLAYFILSPTDGMRNNTFDALEITSTFSTACRNNRPFKGLIYFLTP